MDEPVAVEHRNSRPQPIAHQTALRHDVPELPGVHVIGEHATEVVHIGVMAMLTGSGWEPFNTACFNYPTLGDLYKYAAYDAWLQRGH